MNDFIFRSGWPACADTGPLGVLQVDDDSIDLDIIGSRENPSVAELESVFRLSLPQEFFPRLLGFVPKAFDAVVQYPSEASLLGSRVIAFANHFENELEKNHYDRPFEYMLWGYLCELLRKATAEQAQEPAFDVIASILSECSNAKRLAELIPGFVCHAYHVGGDRVLQCVGLSLLPNGLDSACKDLKFLADLGKKAGKRCPVP